MATGMDVTGIIVVPRRLSIKDVIDDLEIIVGCSDVTEWTNVIRHLPL